MHILCIHSTLVLLLVIFKPIFIFFLNFISKLEALKKIYFAIIV